MLNHGGTEMGQGLNTKVAQVVADAFQVDVDTVRITKTTTEKVPNTSATAASSGSDLNGMAALDACAQIKARLVSWAAETWGVAEEAVRFADNQVHVGDEVLPFAEFIKRPIWRGCIFRRRVLQDAEIHWNRDTGQGRPSITLPMALRCPRLRLIR